MNQVCIDASFLIRLLITKEVDDPYGILWDQWQKSNTLIVAPTLIFYEVTNALYRYVIAEQLTREDVEKLLTIAFNLGIRLYGDPNLHYEAIEITKKYQLSATYDAHYLALAKRLNIDFWTADKRLFNKVNSHFYGIHLVN